MVKKSFYDASNINKKKLKLDISFIILELHV